MSTTPVSVKWNGYYSSYTGNGPSKGVRLVGSGWPQITVAFVTSATDLSGGGCAQPGVSVVVVTVVHSMTCVSEHPGTHAKATVPSDTRISAGGRGSLGWCCRVAWETSIPSQPLTGIPDVNGQNDLIVSDITVAGKPALVAGHRLASVATTGRAIGSGADTEPLGNAVSSQGNSVAFSSAAANVVTGDTNGVRDLFATSVPD